MRLTIELIPVTTMNINLRNRMTPYRWKQLSQRVQQRDHYTCMICGRIKGQDIHKLHCHERWEFDDQHHIQRLADFQSLCFSCHMVKHIGFADMNGWIEKYNLIEHFCQVNNVNKEQFALHLNEAVQIWILRNQIHWIIDWNEYWQE